MLMIKKILGFFILIITFSVFIMSFNTLAMETKDLSPEQLTSQIDVLFTEGSEALDYDLVVQVSNAIIINQEKYLSETLAKTYFLLASVTNSKGDLDSAYQFTQDGLAFTTPDDHVTLCLQIRLASIFSAKKQYNALLDVAQKVIAKPQDPKTTHYYLLALSYRSLALAMESRHEEALVDLQQIESIINQTPSFAEHVTLLSILADTYYHLGDYKTTLTMQLKILKLRFNLNKLGNINQTYYHLGNAYYRLNQFNDAYNAYWEAKKYAEKKKAPIFIAYAHQGLGLTLIQQKQFSDAKTEMLAANSLFYQYNVERPYLETMISLAQINYLTDQPNKAVTLLTTAETLLNHVELTNDYFVLYELLAKLYFEKNDLKKAYFWQKKYSNALLKTNNLVKPSPQFFTKKEANISKIENISANNKTRQLAVKIAEQTEAESVFAKKSASQQTFIFILAGISTLLLGLIILMWLKNRASKLKKTYEALEKPNYLVATPLQTKQLYQKHFSMAKKYAYPLTLGYLSISNWQELAFQFNKKITAEVSREIACLLNEFISEFENVGLINEGEYLLLFPHQLKDEVDTKIEKLVSALKLRLFANLGRFSVTIAYSVESPDFQDIDPYIFLSQLSESIKTV